VSKTAGKTWERVARRPYRPPLLPSTQKDEGGSNINYEQQGDFMARIIVTTDPTTNQAAPVLLDERVYSIHLDNNHNAAQLIQRLGWAIADAENAQRTEQAL
jgi:hypothetical protein